MKTSKKDLYEIVTNRIIEQLEKGVVPWQQPWVGRDKPFNLVSNKGYSMLNSLFLTHPGAYASLKQWNQMGGKIKKGSKSEQVFFWTKNVVKETDKETGEEVVHEVPVLKYYNVFPIDCVEFGEKMSSKVRDYLDRCSQEETFDHTEEERNKKAEEILFGYAEREGLVVKVIESDRAFYSLSEDYVQVPLEEQFKDIEMFYGTLAHELTHSTGAKKRLDRDLSHKFGSKGYAREELVAEMGSAYLMASFGIENEKAFQNNASYIESWISAIRDDPRAIIVAAGKAQKAVERILGGEQ